jgi:hypothetical protein
MPIEWRRNWKRGIASGFLTLFLGPPLGGLMFGLLYDLNNMLLTIGGIVPGPSVGGELIFYLWLPLSFAIGSFFVAWESATAAAAYVALRVGLTGRLGWAEVIVLAVICSTLTLTFVSGIRAGTDALLLYINFRINNLMPGDWGPALELLTCTLFAALGVRWLAGRLKLVR